MNCTACHRPVTHVKYVGLVTTDDDDSRCYADGVELVICDHRGTFGAADCGCNDVEPRGMVAGPHKVTDESVIVALGHAELRLVDEDTREADDHYSAVVRAVVAQFGEEGMDRLSDYWTALRADPEEIMRHETGDPARYVRIARGQ